MTNSTTYDTVPEADDHFHLDPLVPIIANFVLLFIALWILISMIHYGVKTGKWKRNHEVDVEKLNSGWVYTIAVGCAVFAVIRLTTSQVSLHVNDASDHVCEAIFDLLLVEYSHVLLFALLFIWIRQRVFYVNIMLRVKFGKFWHFASYASLFMIVAASYSFILFETIPVDTVSSPQGCVFALKKAQLSVYTWAFSLAILLTLEILLLTLLIHPLYLNLPEHNPLSCCCFSTKKEQNLPPIRMENESSSQENNNSKKRTPFSAITSALKWKPFQKTNPENDEINRATRQSTHIIRTILKRTIIFGSISILSEVLIILVLLTPGFNYTNPAAMATTALVYDLNTLFDLLFVVFSFLSYKRILTSPFRKLSAH